MPSVAFCISGQLRDEHLVLGETAEVARALGATVFVSVWPQRGTKASGVINIHQAYRIFGVDPASVLPDRLVTGVNLETAVPAFSREISRTAALAVPADIHAYFPDAIVDIEGEGLCLDMNWPGIVDNNSLRMLYKIWRCNQMKLACEKRRGARFDLVVRFRPDVVPSLAECQRILASDFTNVVFAPGVGQPPDWLDDMLAISSSPVADSYAALFGKAVMVPQRPWDIVHRELWRHMAEAGVSARPVHLSRGMTEDFARKQPAHRRILIDLIRAGQVDHAFFDRPGMWAAVADLLEAAGDLAEGMTPAQVQDGLRRLDLAASDAALLEKVCVLLTQIHHRTSDLPSIYLAALTMLMCHATTFGEAGLDRQEASHPIGLMSWVAYSRGHDDPFMPAVADAMLEAASPESFARIVFAHVRQLNTEDDLHETMRQIGLRNLRSLDSCAARFMHVLYHKHDPEAARPIAERMIAEFPADWRGLDHLGHYHAAVGDLGTSLDCAERAYAMARGHGGLAARVGDLLLQLDRPQEAVAYLQIGTGDWDHPRAWSMYTTALVRTGQMEQAREAHAEGTRRHPGDAELAGLSEALVAEPQLAAT